MKSTHDGPAETSLFEGLMHHVSILFRYRRLIFLTTASAALVATAFAVLSLALPPEKSPLPNMYAAQASILVQQDGENDLAVSLLEGLGFDQRTNPSASYRNGELVLEILNSRMLLDRLIQEFGMIERYRITGNVKGKSRELVRSRSIIDYSRGAGVLKISFEDIDAVYSCNVVNRMVELLQEWFDLNSGLAVQRQRKLLENKIAEVRTEIAMLQDRLKILQERYGVLSVDDLGRSQSTLLATLRAQLILKEIDIKNYSSISRIDDPRLQQLKDERQNLIDLIAQNQKNVGENTRVAGDGNSLADVAQEFSQLRLQIDIQQRIYNTLAPQYEAAKLAPASIFRVLEFAEVPDTKSGPQRSRIVLLAVLAAFLGSVFLSLVLNAVRGYRTSSASMQAEEPTDHESIETKG